VVDVKRRALYLVLSTSAVLGVIASPPTAVASSKGTCADSYSLVRASKWGAEGSALDRNGDGWLCEKPIPAYPPGSFNVIDDRV
jgi:hypothetical protein